MRGGIEDGNPEGERRCHTVDYDLFLKSQLAFTQLTLGPYVVLVWSRYPLKSVHALRGGIEAPEGERMCPSIIGISWKVTCAKSYAKSRIQNANP